MKKLTVALLFLTLLSAGTWVFLRFAPPQMFRTLSFSATSPKSAAPSADSAIAAQYQQWRDSIDALDLAIRGETDPRMIKLHKERQQYFWRKLSLARRSLPAVRDSQEKAEEHTARAGNTQDLIRLLSRVLTITAAVLVFLIIILLILLKRKKEALTRQLASLQDDNRFKIPRGGFEEKPVPQDEQDLSAPTAVRAPRRKAEKTSRPSPNTIPPTGAIPNRPTARQRVTNALKGLAEALATLKDDRPAVPQDQRPVRSQNSTSPVPDPSVLQPSRYDREQEIKSEILRLTRRGFTSSEIARRLRVPQDQVETVIRLQRDSGA